jgi:hypothetical protein
VTHVCAVAAAILTVLLVRTRLSAQASRAEAAADDVALYCAPRRETAGRRRMQMTSDATGLRGLRVPAKVRGFSPESYIASAVTCSATASSHHLPTSRPYRLLCYPTQLNKHPTSHRLSVAQATMGSDKLSSQVSFTLPRSLRRCTNNPGATRTH